METIKGLEEIEQRVFKYETHTRRLKAWVMLDKKSLPFWPCVVTIRRPITMPKNNKCAEEFLKDEKTMFIVPKIPKNCILSEINKFTTIHYGIVL